MKRVSFIKNFTSLIKQQKKEKREKKLNSCRVHKTISTRNKHKTANMYKEQNEEGKKLIAKRAKEREKQQQHLDNNGRH